MDVSIIVPTFNRVERLMALLDDLGRQDAALSYEILVVDNGSSDRTAVAVSECAAKDPRIRYLLEPRSGASYARNAGIAAAVAPILAFIDDDVRPRADWIRSIYDAFATNPDIDCLGGPVEPRWPHSPPRWLTPAHWGPLALQSNRPSILDRHHASACLVTANFACRASVFEEVGGFSPSFKRDEDREFNLRMWRAGKRGRYLDRVVTYTEVQPERLEKAYHRAWHHVTGRSHARMRYRDCIRADGVLDDSMAATGWHIAGVPGFLLREAIRHVIGWARNTVTGRRDEAFVDECRLRYLGSYVVERLRDQVTHTGIEWRSRRA